MASWAQYYKVIDSIIVTIMVQMSNLENFLNAKTTVSANGWIFFKSNLSVVYFFRHEIHSIWLLQVDKADYQKSFFFSVRSYSS